MRRDWVALPVYEIEKASGKGPQVFHSGGQVIAPDLLIMKRQKKKVVWVEAKHKSVFSWYYGDGNSRWTTGIDLRHYEDYQKLLELVPWDVWLLFLHRENIPDSKDTERWYNCPNLCPTGLYGGNLRELINQESHRSNRWGNSGMVYWAESSLTRLATLKDFLRCID